MRNIAQSCPAGNAHGITREYLPLLPIPTKIQTILSAGLSMAERFGAQAHPNGGLRFGSQTYAALLETAAGDMAAVETGTDVFAALAQPSVNGALGAVESGADTLVASGTSSLSQTMQAHESPAPDTLIATGLVIAGQSYRFGSQVHPLGGLRFGSSSWAALGPNGTMAATESGADTAAAVGWMAGTAYSFAIYDIAAAFVDYSAESLASAVTGTLDDGYKVMLPVAASGIAFAWELNAFGNPSLRLASLTGATILSDVPWYVWDGAAWTTAAFDVSDAMQGAAFMVESGVDVFAGNGSNTRYGVLAATESSGEDFVQSTGAVRVAGALSAAESGSDEFAATGAPHYIGNAALFESSGDTLEADGAIAVAGNLAAAEAGADTFAATGQYSVAGDMAATESGDDTLAATGQLSSSGAMAASETATADTLAGAGIVTVTGALTVAESGADTFAASADSERTGALAVTESAVDVFTSTGSMPVSGALAAPEGSDRFEARGFRISTGAMAAVEMAAFQASGDRFVAIGYGGTLAPAPDLEGPIVAESKTTRNTITSKQQAQAA